MTVLITGSGGLVGSEAVRYYVERGSRVIGVDNDMRRYFFGSEASTAAMTEELLERYEPECFDFEEVDIRDAAALWRIVKANQPELVIHAAAQPAHDWAAKEPLTDFGVNALGTLNLLEGVRRFAPEATFVYCSTSKVYGDNPNRLPLIDRANRLDLPTSHRYHLGIDTSMSIDQCTHSLFGASKASADLLVQEYGRYFGLRTVCFRPGCISGGAHQGAKLHGFLSYMMRCTMTDTPYQVIGYDGLQVRCNIHARDLVRAFDAFHHSDAAPGSVYNIGGGREASVSMWEAMELCQIIAEKKLNWSYVAEPRIGDHRWWISDNSEFQREHPFWQVTMHVPDVLQEIHDMNAESWSA